MSFAIGWLKKENYPFEHYKFQKHNTELVLYFDDIGKQTYEKDFIVVNLIGSELLYSSVDDLVYFKAIDAYNKL